MGCSNIHQGLLCCCIQGYLIAPVTKSQLSMIISRVFKNVHISTVHGYRVCKGIRKYDFDNEECDPLYVQNIAEEQGFFRINSIDSLKFAISSGHCISHEEIS